MAEEVLERAGQDILEESKERPPLGKGLDGIVKEFDDMISAAQSHPRPTVHPEEEIEKAVQEFMASLFGADT